MGVAQDFCTVLYILHLNTIKKHQQSSLKYHYILIIEFFRDFVRVPSGCVCCSSTTMTHCIHKKHSVYVHFHF